MPQETRLIKIGDMTLQDVRDMTATMEEDGDPRGELARFREAQRLVVPVMEAHPGWRWRDAVEHLRKTGAIKSR
jgi:hypothetical protein